MTRKVIYSLVVLLAAGFALAWAAARFDHRAHLEEYIPGTSCVTCHLPGAQVIVPERKVCLECHDEGLAKSAELPSTRTHGPAWALNHRNEAKGSAIDCSACHEQADCLECHKAGFADEQGSFGNSMTNVHRSDFQITHPLAARSNAQQCSSCHETRFCSECHDGFRSRTGRAGGPSHRRAFDLIPSDDPVRFNQIHQGVTATDCDGCHTNSTPPDFHTWKTGHGREARRSLATCQTCHPDGETCVRCHSAMEGAGQVNPHGEGWNGRMGRLKDASNGRTCRKCHTGY